MPKVGITIIIVVLVMVMFQMMILNGGDSSVMYLYRCTVYFVVYLSNTPTNAHM